MTILVMCTWGPTSGLLFALKIFKRLSIEQRRKRFLYETKFLKTCDHPAVMRVHDSGSYQGGGYGRDHFAYPFLIAEYLPRTLADVIRENGATFTEKISYVVQLLSALTYLSEIKPAVIHRDIKPRNIFVKGGSCVLGDFGLLKRMDRDPKLDMGIFQDSIGPGLPFFYRSPDLIAYAKGEGDITPASDLFQLGLVVAELFTGRNPAKRPRHSLDPLILEPLGQIPGGQAAGIASLIKRMLIINPSERPSAKALLDPWQNVLWEAAQKSNDLNGKVF